MPLGWSHGRLTLEKVWEMDAIEGLVADCEALNVAGVAVWMCPYTDFPVVRIRDGAQQVFTAPGEVMGVAGLIVAGSDFGLVGSYKDPALLITGSLQGNSWVVGSRWKLELPDGRPLTSVDIHCRGSVAHLFDANDWYTVDLKDL